MAKKRGTISATAFIAHTLEMRVSVAWRHLPDNARRVLDCLELEHMQHGGAENGNLCCTHDHFARAGIRRRSVALAIRQAVALGFVEVTQQGRPSISDVRRPSLYRLTYAIGRAKSPDPTDEWASFVSAAQAEEALRAAAETCSRLHVERAKRAACGGEEDRGPTRDIDSRGATAPCPVGTPAPLKVVRSRVAGAPY